jgi:hypothetical protein
LKKPFQNGKVFLFSKVMKQTLVLLKPLSHLTPNTKFPVLCQLALLWHNYIQINTTMLTTILIIAGVIGFALFFKFIDWFEKI